MTAMEMPPAKSKILTTTKLSRRTLLLGGTAAAIGLGFGGLADPRAALAAPGYVLNNDGAQTRPIYTITFATAALQAAFSPYLQRSVNELHTFVNTRVILGGVGPRTGAGDEIYLEEAVVGSSCGSVAWGSWDGCGSNILPSNFVSSSLMRMRTSGLSKGADYGHALVSHELGHALGLKHTPDSGQLMHETLDRSDFAGDNTYKAGDRAGLQYLARNTPNPGGGSGEGAIQGVLHEAAGVNNWQAVAAGSPYIQGTRTAAISDDGGRVIYTVRGGQVWEAGTSNWSNQATPITGVTGLSVISDKGGRVVYTIRDGRVCEASTSNWNNLGTPLTGVTDLSVISDKGGRVVYTIRDGRVCEASTSNWNNLGTPITGATKVAAISDGGGRVVYTIRSGQLWEAWPSSTGWQNNFTGISDVTDVSVISDAGGRVVYTLRGGRVWEAGTSSWSNQPTPITGVTDLSVISDSGGRVVYAICP